MSFSFETEETDTNETVSDVTEEPVIRRRGRPPGSKNRPRDTDGTTNTASANPDNVEAPKRRKRKPKAADIDMMSQRLMGLHSMLAGFTGTPEFMLSETEAKMLAESGLQVQQEFDFQVGGKWAVLVTFVGICGVVYVPRFAAMKARAKERKANKPQAQQQSKQPEYPTQSQQAGVTINGTAEYVQ